MARTRTPAARTLAETVPSVAGVAIHDPSYAKADDPHFRPGTLLGFTVRLGVPLRASRRQVWEPDMSWRNCALVQAGGVDMETGLVREWSLGIDGWVPDLSFPTAEAAVKALGKPGVAERLRKLSAEYHAAYKVSREAQDRLLRYRKASLDAAADLGGESSYAWEADRINADLALLDGATVTA